MLPVKNEITQDEGWHFTIEGDFPRTGKYSPRVWCCKKSPFGYLYGICEYFPEGDAGHPWTDLESQEVDEDEGVRRYAPTEIIAWCEPPVLKKQKPQERQLPGNQGNY